MDLAIDVIIVPQGAECRAVRQGLKKVAKKPKVVSIPIGTKQIETTLSEQRFWQANPRRILMLGLCGSLSTSLTVGDLVLYQNCCQQRDHQNQDDLIAINSELNSLLMHKLITQLGQQKSTLVTGLTSQKVITKVTSKRQLFAKFSAQVVDMESYQYLEYIKSKKLDISVLRIVSDDLHFDLPNLDQAISSDGSLKFLSLIAEMARRPYVSSKFVINSLSALVKLREVVELIFNY